MDIAIDFDGTCTTHDFPRIGEDIGAVPVLRKLVDKGHKLILYTMRSDKEGEGLWLSEAKQWFKNNNLPLYGVQFHPTQKDWTTSNKCYAQLYIDDAALGIPLTVDQNLSDRPFVNWPEVEKLLKYKSIL